jgi:hypothetical protein
MISRVRLLIRPSSIALACLFLGTSGSAQRARAPRETPGANTVVARFIAATQRKDLRAVIDLVEFYQGEIANIRNQNPKVLWPKLIEEYYNSKIESLSSGRERIGGLELTTALYLLRDSCKWRIAESRVGPGTATVYVVVDYPSAQDSPTAEDFSQDSRGVSRVLKQTLLKFTVSANPPLIHTINKVAKGDVFWPMQLLSTAAALELAKADLGGPDKTVVANRLHAYIEAPLADIDSNGTSSPWYFVMLPPYDSTFLPDGAWIPKPSYSESLLNEIREYQSLLIKHGLKINRPTIAPDMERGWAVQLPQEWKRYQLPVEATWNRGDAPVQPRYSRFFLDESLEYELSDLRQTDNKATTTLKLTRRGCNPVCKLVQDYWSLKWAQDMASINPEYDGFYYTRWAGGDTNGTRGGSWPTESTLIVYYVWSPGSGWAVARTEEQR